MCDIETLRLFINERLSAVAEDILSVFVRTLVDYQRQLDVLNPPPDVKTQPADFFPACEEAASPQRRERSDREEPYGSTTPVPLLAVKREDDGDDESVGEAEPSAAGTSATTTQADRGTPTPSQPAADDDVQVLSSESDGELTEDSDEWGESGGGDRSALRTPKSSSSSSRRTLLVRAEAGQSLSLRTEPPPPPQDAESSKRIPSSGHAAGEQLFSFPFGGKGFDQGLHVQQSPTGIDTGENCFSCTFCGRSFSQMSNLKKHTMTHTGEKPFWCSVCGKGFNQKVNLKTHFRVHTGEKPFSCTVCGKSFNQHGTVKMHMRVHTGEKPYACSICGKSFSQRGVLKSHMGIHIAQLNTETCVISRTNLDPSHPPSTAYQESDRGGNSFQSSLSGAT